MYIRFSRFMIVLLYITHSYIGLCRVCLFSSHCPSSILVVLYNWSLYCNGAGVAQSVLSDYKLDDRDSIPDRGRIFPLASASRPAMGPTQPPIQWVLGLLPPGVKRGRGVTLSTHLHLVPRSRISRSHTSSPPKRYHGV
jgi:hypothetical protein